MYLLQKQDPPLADIDVLSRRDGFYFFRDRKFEFTNIAMPLKNPKTMSLLYLIGPDARYDFCNKLVDKLCRIPPRYRNDSALIGDLYELFNSLDWVYWNRMLQAAIAHDRMIQTNTWVDSSEERWFKSQLHAVSRNGFASTELLYDIYFNNKLGKLLDAASVILGYSLCDSILMNTEKDHDPSTVLLDEMISYPSQMARLP